MLEQLIDISEGGDHHYEYFSGLNEEQKVAQPAGEEFDPSEPQDFTPPDVSYLSQMRPSETADRPEGDIHMPVASSNKVDGDSDIPEPPPPRARTHTDDLKHAEMFIFSYGVVVFWNFTESQEKAVLADITFAKTTVDGKSLVIRPIGDQDIETEEMHFTYSPKTARPRIYNDMITLRSGDHMIKLAMSHALAQSTKLSRFEAQMDGNMHDVKHVPKMLALTGKLGLKREEVLKISGKLFKLRVDVNLSSNVLDTPDFFWESEPALNPLYTAIREYLEIEQRILVLNERCKVFLELADIIADSIAESNMARITWIIIILIALSLGVSTVSSFES
jgi:uncharacterized Rmd1/YagE family protein